MRSDDPREVEHWLRVYSELVGFKETILDTIGQQRDKVEAEGRLEVQHDDMIFRREYLRLKRRRDYWQQEKDRRSA